MKRIPHLTSACKYVALQSGENSARTDGGGSSYTETTEEKQRNEICCKFCGETQRNNNNKCPAFAKKRKKCGKKVIQL